MAFRAISTLACVFLLVFTSAASTRTINWNGVWPPDPYLSKAISSIEAGQSPYMIVPQWRLRENGCGETLGCAREGILGWYIMISEEATPWFRCFVLVHEQAHVEGWDGDHRDGGWLPDRSACPLSERVRPW